MTLNSLLQKIRTNVPFVVLIVATAVITIAPLGVAVERAWGVWDGVPPAHIEDALFYYARMNAVARGHVFFANPAYIEHSAGVAASFSLSEWFAAVPLILTKSWAVTILWNNIFWPLVTVGMLYFLFRTLKVGRWVSVLGSLFVFAQMILLFERPVVMQIPYAAFVALLLTSAQWLENPTWRRSIVLGICAALGAGAWVFIGGVVGGMLGVLFVALVVTRDWHRVRMMFVAGLVGFVLVLPLIAFQSALLFDPVYPDMLARFGLVVSHIPSVDALYYGRWLLFLMLVVTAVHFLKKTELKNTNDWGLLYFFAVSFALLATLVSPIVTGHDVNAASHAGRFVFPVLAAGVVYVVAQLVSIYKATIQSRYVFWATCCLVLLCVAGLGINMYKRNIPSVPTKATIAGSQTYAPVLAFLELRSYNPVVVWANGDISQYVPIVTKHSVLFVDYGGYYLVPDPEIVERYLISIYPATTSVQSMQATAGQYDLGRVTYMPQASERAAGLCKITRGYLAPDGCDSALSYNTLRGDAYFESIVNQDTKVSRDIKTYLKKYNVSYIVRDTLHDAPLDLKVVGGTKVYDDGRFVVIAL